MTLSEAIEILKNSDYLLVENIDIEKTLPNEHLKSLYNYTKGVGIKIEVNDNGNALDFKIDPGDIFEQYRQELLTFKTSNKNPLPEEEKKYYFHRAMIKSYNTAIKALTNTGLTVDADNSKVYIKNVKYDYYSTVLRNILMSLMMVVTAIEYVENTKAMVDRNNEMLLKSYNIITKAEDDASEKKEDIKDEFDDNKESINDKLKKLLSNDSGDKSINEIVKKYKLTDVTKIKNNLKLTYKSNKLSNNLRIFIAHNNSKSKDTLSAKYFYAANPENMDSFIDQYKLPTEGLKITFGMSSVTMLFTDESIQTSKIVEKVCKAIIKYIDDFRKAEISDYGKESVSNFVNGKFKD